MNYDPVPTARHMASLLNPKRIAVVVMNTNIIHYIRKMKGCSPVTVISFCNLCTLSF